MQKEIYSVVSCCVLVASVTASAQVSISPLSSFGSGGWLAPGSSPHLTVNDTERGLAFGNDHLYLVSRAGGDSVRILNPITGADIGGLNMTGIPAPGATGATFGVNMAAVGGDGAIYVGNLTLNASTANSPFVVYKWATESSTPTVAYSGTPLAGGRVGDSLAAFGSGSSTRLAAGFGSSPAVTGDNGFAILDPTAHSATQVTFSRTPPNPGDFRLGITFGADANHVMGAQSGNSFRETSVSGGTGTLLASPALHSTSERLLAYAVIGGIPVLAAESTTDAHVSLYNMTDPARPVFLGSANATTGALHANTRDVGELSWGKIAGNTGVLYALSTDQGIQAFTVTVPEPGALTLAALGLGILGVWQNRRRK
jgi:hypothetical protein